MFSLIEWGRSNQTVFSFQFSVFSFQFLPFRFPFSRLYQPLYVVEFVQGLKRCEAVYVEVQKALNAAADAFRVNPEFDTKELMQNLGTGEAVVSMLDEKGAPSMAEYAFVLPPQSRMGALSDEERQTAVDNSPLNSKYLEMVDKVSAYEVITGKGAQPAPADTMTAPDGQVYGNTSGIPAAEPQDEPEISIDVEIEDEETAATKKKVKKSAETEEEQGSSIGNIADNLLGSAGTRRVIRSTGDTIGREIGKSIGEAVLGKKGRTIGGNIGSSIGRNLFGTLSKK